MLDDRLNLLQIPSLEAMQAAWTVRSPLRFPVGHDPQRAMAWIDLRARRHWSISGGAGVGKSHLLHTALGYLAAEHSPHRVQFAHLSSYATSPMLLTFPHTVLSICDRDPNRILRPIDAELHRRWALLDAAGTPPDLPDLIVAVEHLYDAGASVVDAALQRVLEVGHLVGMYLILLNWSPPPPGAVDRHMEGHIMFSPSPGVRYLPLPGVNLLRPYGQALVGNLTRSVTPVSVLSGGGTDYAERTGAQAQRAFEGQALRYLSMAQSVPSGSGATHR